MKDTHNYIAIASEFQDISIRDVSSFYLAFHGYDDSYSYYGGSEIKIIERCKTFFPPCSKLFLS